MDLWDRRPGPGRRSKHNQTQLLRDSGKPSRVFGEDDEACGQKIELYAEKAPYQGGETDNVLVMPFSPLAATRKPQSDSDDGMSDEIPFN